MKAVIVNPERLEQASINMTKGFCHLINIDPELRKQIELGIERRIESGELKVKGNKLNSNEVRK